MSIQILRLDDIHGEALPSGGAAMVPHLFQCLPRASARVVRIHGDPLLREGDAFENETSPDHQQPKIGASFVATPSGKGSFTQAGQSVFRICGTPVMTMAGKLETCSDGPAKTRCKAAVILRGRPLIFVNGSPVLEGKE